MAYCTFEEFDDQLTDILSSGSVDDMTPWHTAQVTELIAGMDRDRVITDLNIWYAEQHPDELREGELSGIAEMLKGTVSTKIVFE